MQHIPQVLDAATLAELRAALDGAPWQDGSASAGTQAAAVKRNAQLPAGPLRERLAARVLAALQGHALFMAAALPLRWFAPHFNRCADGGHYGDHVDGAVRLLPGGGHLRTDLSATLFLSAPQEYEGGELHIDGTGDAGHKLPAGDLLLYPATQIHRVAPVTRGVRLAAFFWVQSLVRHAEQRRLLLELDLAIMALRQRHGDGPDTLRLTGVYHGLLQRWSQT